MRRLILLLLVVAAPAWCTWSMATGSPKNNVCGSGSSACNTTVTSTTAGDLGIVFLLSPARTISSITTGGTWTACTACRLNDATCGCEIDAYYNVNLTGGVTSLSINLSSAAGNGTDEVVFIEYHSTIGSQTLDKSANLDISSATSHLTAPTLAITGSNDVVANGLTISSSVGSINSSGGFSSPNLVTANANGVAGAINVSTGAGTTFNVSAGSATGVIAALAFCEGGSCGGGGPTVIPHMTLLGVGR